RSFIYLVQCLHATGRCLLVKSQFGFCFYPLKVIMEMLKLLLRKVFSIETKCLQKFFQGNGCPTTLRNADIIEYLVPEIPLHDLATLDGNGGHPRRTRPCGTRNFIAVIVAIRFPKFQPRIIATVEGTLVFDIAFLTTA